MGGLFLTINLTEILILLSLGQSGLPKGTRSEILTVGQRSPTPFSKIGLFAISAQKIHRKIIATTTLLSVAIDHPIAVREELPCVRGNVLTVLTFMI